MPNKDPSIILDMPNQELETKIGTIIHCIINVPDIRRAFFKVNKNGRISPGINTEPSV